MADIVTPEVRSRMMAGIKGKNTIPELVIRKGLHMLGFRYRLHNKKLPGKPDLVFSKYHAVILVHGCFWHGHNCHLFRFPASRPQFWKTKIEGNRCKDMETLAALSDAGWRVLVVWECALKGKTRRKKEEVLTFAAHWLEFGQAYKEIRGNDGYN